jgi:hypothetical protein
VARIKVKTFATIGKKDIGQKIAKRERTSKEKNDKGIMLIMDKLLCSFQPCLFLLMTMHGTSTLEHQCTFHTNINGSWILKKTHL